MTNERPAKRRRTTTSSVFDTRKADPDVHEDVDTLILDYVIHNAIEAIFRERDAEGNEKAKAISSSNTHFSLVESFLTVFKSQHAGAAVPGTISFRLALLRFVVLFTRRGDSYASEQENKHTKLKKDTRDKELLASRDLSRPSVSALAALRKQNSRRAHRWNQGSQLQPVTAPDDSNAEQYRDATRVRRIDSANQIANDDVHLLDLIPSFISLTKRRARLAADDWETSQQWLELAADFMLLAAAESSSVESKEPDKFVKEAFAWGPLTRRSDHESNAMAIDGTVDPSDRDLQHDDENDIFLVNPRSRSQIGEVADSGGKPSREEAAALWYRIRASRIATLQSKAGSIDVLRLGEYMKFVRSMHEYTSALAESVSAPLLSQLEDAAVAERQGKSPKVELDGEMLTVEETNCLLRLWMVDLRSPRMAHD